MANQQQRDQFLLMIRAIEQGTPPGFARKDDIAFTLEESTIDFLHGEEELAFDMLIENLVVGFPVTDEIVEAIARLGQDLGLPHHEDTQ